MPRTVFLYMLLITLLVAGCGQSTRPEPLKTSTTKPPALDDEWTIKMNYSGGFMGLSRSVEILSNGKFTVVDERRDKTITGELTADELSKVSEQVMSFEYTPASKPDGMNCADCFIYDLEIQANGKRVAIQLNDINLSNSGLEPLVDHLRGLIETTLK